MREAFGISPYWMQWLRWFKLCFFSQHTDLLYYLNITRILIYVIGFSRYSTFYVLYPSGITSEVYLIYLSIPYVKVMKLEKRKKSKICHYWLTCFQWDPLRDDDLWWFVCVYRHQNCTVSECRTSLTLHLITTLLALRHLPLTCLVS